MPEIKDSYFWFAVWMVFVAIVCFVADWLFLNYKSKKQKEEEKLSNDLIESCIRLQNIIKENESYKLYQRKCSIQSNINFYLEKFQDIRQKLDFFDQQVLKNDDILYFLHSRGEETLESINENLKRLEEIKKQEVELKNKHKEKETDNAKG